MNRLVTPPELAASDLARFLERSDSDACEAVLTGRIDAAALAMALESLNARKEIHPIIRLAEAVEASGRGANLSDDVQVVLGRNYARALLTAFVPGRAADILTSLAPQAERVLSGPAQIDLRLLLAHCQLKAGRSEAALAMLADTERRWPNDCHAFVLHLELLAKSDPQEALALLRRIEADPVLARCLEGRAVLRGNVLVASGLPGEALARAEATMGDELNALHALVNAQAGVGDRVAWASAMDRYLRLASRSELGICKTADGDILTSFGREKAPAPPAVAPAPRLAVILCAYNAADTLRSAVASVLAQTYEAFRLILVDDGSKDGTGDIIRSIAAADPRVSIIENSANLGVYRSKNSALKLVAADYYTFLDADDWMHPERLGRAMAIIEATPRIACVYSRWVRIDRSGRLETPPMENRASSLFSRKIIEEAGGFDPVRFSADAEFQWRLRARYGSDAVVTSPDVLTVGLRHPASLTSSALSGFDAFGSNILRSTYAESFLRWHMDTPKPRMPAEIEEQPRAFVAPVEMTRLSEAEPDLDPFAAAHAAATAGGGVPIVVCWPDAAPGGHNWGDNLNPFLVELLSGRPAINASHPDADRNASMHFVIGSGLGGAGAEALIWGSGFIKAGLPLRASVNRIRAVRGPLTARRIAEAGGDTALPMGDPALLLPLFYRPEIEPRYDIGIIQHFREAGTEPLPRLPVGTSVRLIDITGGIKQVIDAVLSCRRILSSSLHGLIVSHAYGVPATWMKISDRPLGDDFKFHDYWASIGHANYAPLDARNGARIDPAVGVSAPGEVMVDLFALLEACPFIAASRRRNLIETARAHTEGRTILAWHAGRRLKAEPKASHPTYLSPPANRWCIFTSAGDHSHVSNWQIGTSVPTDLIIAFYGDSDDEFEKLKQVSRACIRIKGSKFQNLKWLADKRPDLFENYSYIWACDDDIIMSSDQIVRTFEISERLDLWAAQPSFNKNGKAPHLITHSQYPTCDVRLTTFIEVTCPLFRADKLRDFLYIYDGSLIGWGIDWWFCHYLGSETNWRLGIFDCIEVTNPLPDQRRGGVREILRMATNEEREAQWRTVQASRGIPEVRHRVLARLTLSEEQS
ncbi:glycosyltransferase [Methylorubrum sp. SB2]|uniref:glycosyltransferase n=1 Tax=Methylorubrum subtropicum TaxID=3138812 RepID=UPI00313DAA68